jgi:hypothetical protein
MGLPGLAPPVAVTAAESHDADPAPPATLDATGFAKPKSISFAPLLVSMMLAGFKSRCTTP